MTDFEDDPELALALQLSKEEAERDARRRNLDIGEDMGNVASTKFKNVDGSNKLHSIQSNLEVLGDFWKQGTVTENAFV
jgi:hypothetical protein